MDKKIIIRNAYFIFNEGDKLPFEYKVLEERGVPAGTLSIIKMAPGGEIYEMLYSPLLKARFFKMVVCDWGANDRERVRKCLINYDHKFVNYAVFKNATNSVFALFFPGEVTEEESGPYMWRKVWELKASDSFVDYTESKYIADDSFAKFFIYRDPVKRFISLCNFVWGGIRLGGPHGVPDDCKEKDKIIENFLIISELLAGNKDPLVGNGHTRSQASNLYYLEDDRVDYMVKLEDIGAFVKEKFGVEQIHTINKSKPNITVEDITPSQMERLLTVMQADYDLFERFKHKLYVPQDAQ